MDQRRRHESRRAITAAEVDTFWLDGVVCLRGVLDRALLDAMAAPVGELVRARSLADMSAMGESLERSGETVLRDTTEGDEARGRFISGVDHWRGHEAFRFFACDSTLPAIAAALLGANTVYLWEDSLLVKEPGTKERTAWHQDLGYFHAAGEQICTTWCPLDPVTAATGAVRFVRASHRWSTVFRPNLFVSTMAIPGTRGDDVPDIDAMAERGDVDVLVFDTDPGDITVHHARTLHAAGANRSATQTRRAISVRYCGDDVRYHIRPGAPMKAHHRDVHNGDVLGGPDAPVVWPR